MPELSRSKLASIVSTTIMDNCQQFMEKVRESRFLKIKENLFNKFNRLLLKKQGNITWFSTLPPLGNPWAESASAQVASNSVLQAGSPWAESTAQAPSASFPQTNRSQAVSFQVVSTNSSPKPQAKSADPQVAMFTVPWAESTAQATSTSSPKTSSSQVLSSQVVSTNSQGVRTIQAGNTESADAQAASALLQTFSKNSQGVSTVPIQVGISRAVSVDTQAASTSPQTYRTNSQGAIATLPQASQANRHSNRVNNPQGSPRGNSLVSPNPK